MMKSQIWNDCPLCGKKLVCKYTYCFVVYCKRNHYEISFHSYPSNIYEVKIMPGNYWLSYQDDIISYKKHGDHRWRQINTFIPYGKVNTIEKLNKILLLI